MSESRVRENLMHGLMRGGRKFHPPTLLNFILPSKPEGGKKRYEKMIALLSLYPE